MSRIGENDTSPNAVGVPSSRLYRYHAGKALRRRVPREVHSACPKPRERDAIALLRATDRARIPALLPTRYERMAKSAFGILRGAESVMARDLAVLPAAGILVQACGDRHVKNFGAFTSPEGQILFDINDFDEILPDVDFTLELKRLAASVAVRARDRAKTRHFRRGDRRFRDGLGGQNALRSRRHRSCGRPADEMSRRTPACTGRHGFVTSHASVMPSAATTMLTLAARGARG